jgi:hypothetical protein
MENIFVIIKPTNGDEEYYNVTSVVGAMVAQKRMRELDLEELPVLKGDEENHEPNGRILNVHCTPMQLMFGGF